jgi:DNA modification methylase
MARRPLAVIARPTDELTPYDKNARTHSDAQVAQVAASIKEFGWTQPILVDRKGTIVAGHARHAAAKLLGLKSVPTIELAHLTPEQVRAYTIADNRLAESAEWDDELLAAELKALEDAGFDLELVGFTQAELYDMGIFGEGGAPDEQPAPLPPDRATSRGGDLWVLGDHRLLCGDSASVDDLDRLLAGAPIHLVHMDPPYNVKVEPRLNNAIAAGLTSFTSKEQRHHQKFDLARHPEKSKPTTRKMRAKDRPLANDFITAEAFDLALRAWFSNASRALLPGHAVYIWGGYANLGNYPSAIAEAGIYFSQAIVWNKLHPVLTRKDFMGAFELAFYGWKEGGPHRFFGPNNVPDLWDVKKLNHTAMVHLTEKPVELAARAMQYSSLPGEHVLDLFGGSGSTLIGAQQTGRKAFLVEIDPAYTDVIVDRWQRLTGLEAHLETKGKPTFAKTKLERAE